MKCNWKELLSILPPWMATEADYCGREVLQELRLRVGQPLQFILKEGPHSLRRIVSEEDILFCVNTASRYSPWTVSTVSKGYISAPGGHRIGVCGEAVIKNGNMETIKNISSVCIRVARDFPGLGKEIPKTGSLLILGAPGWGKTTLLRDLIRQRSESGFQIAVVDERGELFPPGFSPGNCTDVLTGCPKTQGISILLRTMGPQCIAVDEITCEEDCIGLLQAVGCGVELMATIHAASAEDLCSRQMGKNLLQAGIFDWIVLLRKDKTWTVERI